MPEMKSLDEIKRRDLIEQYAGLALQGLLASGRKIPGERAVIVARKLAEALAEEVLKVETLKK